MRQDAGRALPRGRRPRSDPAQLQERPAALRGRPRHPRQGRHPGHDRRAVRHRRGLPGADRRAGIRAGWSPSSASRRSAKARGAGKPCEMVILALGKFGGREMNYHSDLDIVFLYEADGHTAADVGRRRPAPRRTSTSSASWAADHQSGQPLEQLRAAVRSRCPAAPDRQERLAGHHVRRVRAAISREGDGQLWERQALCKARVVYGSPRAAKAAMAAVAEAAFDHRWRRSDAAEIRQMRQPPGRDRGRGQSETRPRRHRRHRVPRADAATQARPRQSRASACPTRSRPSAIARAGPALGRRLRAVRRRLSSAADDRGPAAADELHRPRPVAARPRRTDELANLLHYPSSDGLLADYETRRGRFAGGSTGSRNGAGGE